MHLGLALGINSSPPNGRFVVFDTTTGSLGPYVTFTRSSTANYFNSSGVSVQAAVNEARLAYDPITLAFKGYFHEGARTNLILWNRDLTNAAWVKVNTSVSKTATGIDGIANSASTVTATMALGTILQAVTSASAARSTTAYVKRRTGIGTVEMTQDGGLSWTVVTVTSSWTRVGPATATVANPSVGFRLTTSGDAIDIDFVQLENASIPSSHIETTTASATRAADSAIVSSLSSVGYNQSEGTIYSEFEMTTIGVIAQNIYSINDTGGNNYIDLIPSGSTDVQSRVRSGGTTSAFLQATGASANSLLKVAVGYKTNNSNMACNGNVGILDTTVTIPTVTRIQLGVHPTLTQPMFGYFRRMESVSVRYSDSELDGITT